MRLSLLYAALALVGLALPLMELVNYCQVNSGDFNTLFRQFMASYGSRYMAWEVLVTTVVSLVFILAEGRRLGLNLLWVPLLGTLAFGISFGLPFFLFMGQRELEKSRFQDQSV